MYDSDRDIQGEPKSWDKYPDIESFQNRTFLPVIEIKESLKKRKGSIISPREEGRAIKVRITNNEEEEKVKEYCKERQVKRGEVTEEEPLFDINYMYDDKDNSVEL